jgi:hypothetical protein
VHETSPFFDDWAKAFSRNLILEAAIKTPANMVDAWRRLALLSPMQLPCQGRRRPDDLILAVPMCSKISHVVRS